MLISQEQLNAIVESHGKWLKNEQDGKRANLREADLRYADLRDANLRGADLRDADLQDADLRYADLRDAYLQGADLRGADLQGANLQDADLPNGIYQIVGCGSENRCTTYDSINDRIICGCWNDNNGNTITSFEQRINDIYGENGKKPNKKYFAEYMSAIAFFKSVKEEAK